MGLVNYKQGRYEEALSHYEEALAMRQALLAADDPTVVASRMDVERT